MLYFALSVLFIGLLVAVVGLVAFLKKAIPKQQPTKSLDELFEDAIPRMIITIIGAAVFVIGLVLTGATLINK